MTFNKHSCTDCNIGKSSMFLADLSLEKSNKTLILTEILLCGNEGKKQQGVKLKGKVKSCSLFSMQTLDPIFIYLSNLFLFNWDVTLGT